MVASALLAAAGCASEYTYQPATNATATVKGHVAAYYPLPDAVHPQGDARVASFGIAKIKRADESQLRTLHLRVVVSNNSQQPWQLDVNQQRVQLKGGATLSPAFAQSDGQDVPDVHITPGGKRTVDLFFALPEDQARASRIPEFDAIWRVETGTQPVVQRTPFDRLVVEPAYASTGWYGPGWWGPYGWYDPFWGPGYIGAPGWYW
jgi:hypothetical protein